MKHIIIRILLAYRELLNRTLNIARSHAVDVHSHPIYRVVFNLLYCVEAKLLMRGVITKLHSVDLDISFDNL